MRSLLILALRAKIKRVLYNYRLNGPCKQIVHIMNLSQIIRLAVKAGVRDSMEFHNSLNFKPATDTPISSQFSMAVVTCFLIEKNQKCSCPLNSLLKIYCQVFIIVL